MKRLLKTILVLFLIIVLSGSAFLIFQGYRNYQTLSEAHPISELIRDEQGKQEYVKLEEISPYLVDATISVEDKNFYEHGGVDLAGVARAVLSNLFGIGEPSGGSTISQQLCKNLYGLFYDTSLTRKITEAFLTYDLEKNYEKDDIIELYLNVINYGDGYTGVYQASMGYFGKEPSELSLDEASLLAGIPQSPGNLQLSNHYEDTKKKQKIVLEAMVREQKINQEQMDEITGES